MHEVKLIHSDISLLFQLDSALEALAGRNDPTDDIDFDDVVSQAARVLEKFVDLTSLDTLTGSDTWNDIRSLLEMDDVTDAQFADFVDEIVSSYVNTT